MFIKIIKSGKYKYAQAVESYRQDGVVKHKVLFNLGRLDIIQENASFQNFVRAFLNCQKHYALFDLYSMSEAEISN